MDAAENAELDRLLANFFFGCNVPFVTVESTHFKEFVHRLNPNYNIPSRKVLSTHVLDRRFEEHELSITNVAPREAVLLLDGWKNKSANTKNVVAMMRLSNDRYVFLDSWNFSAISETGDELSRLVNQCINMARDKYNIDIYAVITDNASNMKRMGRLVDIWHVTCNSHSSNLLCKSLTDGNFATRVNNILREFKSPDLESELRTLGGNRMVLIAETRWSSHRDAFRRCLKNLPLMRTVAGNQREKISNEVYHAIMDPQLEPMLQDHLLLLDPICELTNQCQKANCMIADAVELWLKLEVPAANQNFENLIEERRRKAICPLGLAANFLHPVYLGLRFLNNPNFDQLQLQMDAFFDHALSREGKQELDSYKNRQGLFGTLIGRNFTKYSVFWNSTNMFYPHLSKLALKIGRICASTAQLERLFSEWAYVHSTKRNRLTDERSKKLVSLYYEMRLNDIYHEDEDFEDLL